MFIVNSTHRSISSPRGGGYVSINRIYVGIKVYFAIQKFLVL